MKATFFAAAFLLSCSPGKEAVEPSAEVGIFFGGQLQRARRVEVPTARPPTIGFRVHVPPGTAPKVLAEEVRYEITRPGPAGRRVTEKGTLKIPPNQGQVDQVFPLGPPRKLGHWNIRVVQGDQLLADRALYLVSPSPSK